MVSSMRSVGNVLTANATPASRRRCPDKVADLAQNARLLAAIGAPISPQL
jgi:hypothetical protein